MEPLLRTNQLHKAYMDIAFIVASLSRASKRKVGAVIVKDGNIVGFGFNGTPHGMPNACEDESGKTFPYVVHAEVNAILKAGENCEGATMYCTCYPCYSCAVIMKQAKIKAFYYREDHKNDDRLSWLGISNCKI